MMENEIINKLEFDLNDNLIPILDDLLYLEKLSKIHQIHHYLFYFIIGSEFDSIK